MPKFVSRRMLCALFGFGLLSGAASAATPAATGLGQAWPNAQDVSANPNYHAYLFVLGGIHYIQINDLNGNVLGSVATSGGQFITLPIGKFAAQVVTPQQPAAAPSTAAPSASAATVYNDSSTSITATPLSDGTVQLMAQSICSDPASCSTHGGA